MKACSVDSHICVRDWRRQACAFTANIDIFKEQEFLSSDISLLFCSVCLTHLVSGVKAQVLVALFTVMVGVVGCIFRQLHPGCSPAQVHVLLTPSICFETIQKIQPHRVLTGVKSVNVVT